MDFKKFYENLTPDEKKKIAEKCGFKSMRYLSHLATGYRKAGLKMILKIEKATNGAVTAEMLRPDLYEKQTAQ